jgi:hypothetical protein
MTMNSLQNLHQSMRKLNVEMQQFQVHLGIADFDCLFSTRETPFVFSMTSRGENPKFFKFDVKTGYWIDDYFGDIYYNLCSVLRIDGQSGKLYPKDFLNNLNQSIPNNARADAIPSPENIIRLRQDVEMNDKPYFDTWIYWKDQEPSKENQHKTLLALGKDAYDYSLQMKASSKWSTSPTRRDWKNERR